MTNAPEMPIGVDEQGSASHLAALDAMERYGGGFVRHLAAAWKRADGENHARLVDAFRHYLDQYCEMAARDQGYRPGVKP